MLFLTDANAYATLAVNSNIYTLEGFSKYYKYLKVVRRNKYSTIISRLRAVYHFWLWTLCTPADTDEDLQLYFARYLVALEKGFVINSVTFLKEFNEEQEYIVFESKPKLLATIEKEKGSIEVFLKYIKSLDAEKYALEKNFLRYAHQAANNKGAGYGLRMSKYMQRLMLNEVSILPSVQNRVIGDIKAFPYNLFDTLLDIAEPREKLFYLLCGACSARRTQALNLTLYDIDYTSKNVWLIDPRSNDQLGFDGRGRKSFLWEEYGIDAAVHSPHNRFGFKAPIPKNFKERMPLLWLHDGYKRLFFETLADYRCMPEGVRKPRHPFLFITLSGKRLSPEFVNDRFKRHLKILKEKFPEYSYRLEGLSIHSLRHMFGSVMATLEAKLTVSGQAYRLNNNMIRWLTSTAMGHRNDSSTNVYFNRPWDVDIEVGEYINSLIEDQKILSPVVQKRGESYGKKH